MEAASSFPWSTSSELALFQILAKHKPAGMNKHFSMAVAVEALANTLDAEEKQVTGEDIWAKLRTMYDLAAVDDREEVIPFPLEEREFSLPRREFSSLISEKQKEIQRDRKEVQVRKSGVVRMGQDMGPEGALRRAPEGSKVVRVVGDNKVDGKRGEEKEQTGKREEDGLEDRGKLGGIKRHATRSTPSSSGANTPAKRRANK